MDLVSDVAAFAAVAGLLTIIPGMDTALVLRTAITQGRRQGFATGLGINAGVLVWGAGATVGISALLIASHTAYTTLRILGAAYMVWLGASLLWHSWARRNRAVPYPPESDPVAARGRGGFAGAWARGVLTNVSNPKVGAFYVAVLPQFIPEHAPHLAMGLLLALVHDAEEFGWFTLIIFGADLIRSQLARPYIHRALDRITGAVLVGSGVELALSER